VSWESVLGDAVSCLLRRRAGRDLIPHHDSALIEQGYPRRRGNIHPEFRTVHIPEFKEEGNAQEDKVEEKHDEAESLVHFPTEDHDGQNHKDKHPCVAPPKKKTSQMSDTIKNYVNLRISS